ncbi:MAG TPA: flavodoxin family protein [Syntrophobacteraceae bacterium]|nr:flavodoxin family protein [Syntrophobacteraceae bacterium]
MKIACLLASPRKNGNSSTLAKHFCNTAEGLGAQITTFALNELKYRGCQACMACKTRLDRCVLEDDLTEVLQTVRKSDLLVMASPVYFGEVSSQLKGFIDRTYSYLVPDYLTNPNRSRLRPGKTVVFVLTQGRPDEKFFADIFPRYEFFFHWHGFHSHLIRACGVREAGEVKDRKELLGLAEKKAHQLLTGKF